MILFRSGPIRKSFRHIPTLETPRLLLRQILPKDEKDMYEYARNPETSRYLLWEPHSSPEFTRAHIRYLQDQYRKASFFDWAIIDKKSDKMIGTIGFTEIYERERRAEIGYVLSPDFHRQGLVPEALQRVMEYGFQTLHLLRLEARFMADNEASRKVLIRAGFSDATRKKEYIWKRGKKQYIYTYSLCQEEYLKKQPCEN